MLTRLEISNYRGFEQHTIPLRPTTVIVGRNNAGKSTVVEMLRLVSLVTSRYRSLPYRSPPDWMKVTGYQRVVSPSLKGMEFNFVSVFHRYGDPPAKVTAFFDSGKVVSVHIGPEEEVFATVGDEGGGSLGNKAQAARFQLDTLSILPQVAPVVQNEQLLTEKYVRGAMSSSLAPLHFRNQLHFSPDLFDEFRGLAQSSWPGLRIKELRLLPASPEREAALELFVQDGDFVAELANMGHGLQMWLQAIWFLTRCAGDVTVILDEPDVYMHADLQRRLMRLVQRRHHQVIVATHSVEILSQTDPQSVLVLDRAQRSSRFATSLPGLQSVIDSIGGVHNVQIARLWKSRRFLLLEGDDLRVLRHLHATLCPGTDTPLDDLPNVSIGGWGGWDAATRSGVVLRNAGGQPITTYCILDRDYHTDEEVAARMAQARQRGVRLHVWTRKEVENYLLVPHAIQRAIASSPSFGQAPGVAEVVAKMEEITADLKDQVLDGLATYYLAMHKSEGLSAANADARRRLGGAWETLEGRIRLVPGKAVVSALARWAQVKYGVSVSSVDLARALRGTEIATEVRRVLGAIESRGPFPK